MSKISDRDLLVAISDRLSGVDGKKWMRELGKSVSDLLRKSNGDTVDMLIAIVNNYLRGMISRIDEDAPKATRQRRRRESVVEDPFARLPRMWKGRAREGIKVTMKKRARR